MVKPLASKVIVLTADAELQAKLRRKLTEYLTRNRFRAPEVDPHATFKAWILGVLLEKGRADLQELKTAWQMYGWFDEYSFWNAAGVIDAYNSSDTSLLHGGTGLK